MRHEAWCGITVDHLYKDCPSLRRSVTRTGWKPVELGTRCVDRVDPEGGFVCGLCYQRWLTKQAKGDGR